MTGSACNVIDDKRLAVAAMPNATVLLWELNHRVKNNFQIIVSLMNLKKRMMPLDRRGDIRFLEEHVQSMAVAYRLVYATGDMTEVPVGELLGELVSELRQIARLSADQVLIESASVQDTMGLDQAIALGLYLAVVLPPYLDRALTGGGSVFIRATEEEKVLTLSIGGSWPEPIPPDLLRTRLSEGYAGQLLAETISLPDAPELRICLRLDERRPAITSSQSSTPSSLNPASN